MANQELDQNRTEADTSTTTTTTTTTESSDQEVADPPKMSDTSSTAAAASNTCNNTTADAVLAYPLQLQLHSQSLPQLSLFPITLKVIIISLSLSPYLINEKKKI